MITLPPWSYTALDTFDQCPRKYYHRYILKEKEPESPAMLYGQQVHAALENRINGAPLPEHMMKFSPMAESVVNAWQTGMKCYTELKMGITRKFEPCDFFDKGIWGRSAADVILKKDDAAMVFDWKTGKKREKELQLLILALFTFIHFPTVNIVTGVNLWLESGDIGTPYRFERSQVPTLWRPVLERILKMEKACAENKWPELPGPLCGYCPVKTCQFNRS